MTDPADSPAPEIRPAFFTFDTRGAVIRVADGDKPIDVLITGKDRLRLASMLFMAMSADERETVQMMFPGIPAAPAAEFARTKLTLAELRALKVGDKVWARYTEHSDDGGPRTDCEHEVIETDGEQLRTQDLPHRTNVWEWNWDEWQEGCKEFDCCGEGKGEVWHL